MEKQIEGLNIVEIKKKAELIHKKVSQIVEVAEIKGEMLREYNNKVSQFNGMYEAVESMKSVANNSDTIEGLLVQQREILQNWMDFELTFSKRCLKEGE